MNGPFIDPYRMEKFAQTRSFRLQIQLHAAFFRDPLDRAQRTASARLRYVVLVRALFCGYFDFALELVRSGFDRDVGEDDRRKPAGLVEKLASYAPSSARDVALALTDDVNARPDNANVSVGRFVDARRAICDFEDVLENQWAT